MRRPPMCLSPTQTCDATAAVDVSEGSAALVLLNWNSWQNTVECLESLQQLTYSNYRMVVVDNGSTDDSLERIRAWAQGRIAIDSDFIEHEAATKPIRVVEYDRVTAQLGGLAGEEVEVDGLAPEHCLVFIQCGENLGIAGGYNVGIRYALARGYDYIWVMNNDVVLDPLSLQLCVETLDSNPRIGVVGPKILYYSNPSRIWYAGGGFRLWRGLISHVGVGARDGPQFSGLKCTAHVSGCALLARREAFEQVGLWSEDYFVIHEDCDWSARVQRDSDFTLAVNLDARIWHKEGGVSDTGHTSPVSAYFTNRNRIILVFRYGSWLEKVSFVAFFAISRLPKFLLLLLRGRRDLVRAELSAVVDFLLSRYGPADERRMRLWRSS